MEVGHDGVGDYSLRLANELSEQKHIVSLIALNDHYVKPTETEAVKLVKPRSLDKLVNSENHRMASLTIDNGEYFSDINTLRLSSKMSWQSRVEIAERFVHNHKCDWLSLQYVPYSFSIRGMPLQLQSIVNSIRRSARLSIMFHELWIGPKSLHKPYEYLVGSIQKSLIRSLCREADMVHTHLPTYIDKIRALGFNALSLPLYSNIPLASPSSLPNYDGMKFRFVFFSIFTAPRELVLWLNTLIDSLLLQGKDIELHFCGRATLQEQEEWVGLIGGRSQLFFHGWMNPQQISEIMLRSHCGVSGLPQHCLGKSGSVAAFISHSLPVLAPLISLEHSTAFTHEALNQCIVNEPTTDSIKKAYYLAKRASSLLRIEQVVAQYCIDLQRADS